MAQLLSIIHEIQITFDNNPAVDMRGAFLDISKAFHKVWHIGLLFKLKAYGVDGELLSMLTTLNIVKKGCFKWSDFWLEENKFWSSKRIGIRAPFVFNLHKWSAWWNNM